MATRLTYAVSIAQSVKDRDRSGPHERTNRSPTSVSRGGWANRHAAGNSRPGRGTAKSFPSALRSMRREQTFETLRECPDRSGLVWSSGRPCGYSRMSGGRVSDFPVGSELELDLGYDWRWYRLMHKFQDGGGWVRELSESGELDNSRDGIIIVPAARVVRSSRNVPRKAKATSKHSGGDPLLK